MPEDREKKKVRKTPDDNQETTGDLQETLKETQRLLQSLIDENKTLKTEIAGVKEANLRLAKSMPAKPEATFESAIAEMFDLKKGGEKK